MNKTKQKIEDRVACWWWPHNSQECPDTIVIRRNYQSGKASYLIPAGLTAERHYWPIYLDEIEWNFDVIDPDVHIERLSMLEVGPQSFTAQYSQCWRVRPNPFTFTQALLSLRIHGYLVDYWTLHEGVVGLTHKPNSVIRVVADQVVCANFQPNPRPSFIKIANNLFGLFPSHLGDQVNASSKQFTIPFKSTVQLEQTNLRSLRRHQEFFLALVRNQREKAKQLDGLWA